MTENCSTAEDGRQTAKPRSTHHNLETYGELSVSKEKIGKLDSYTIDTEYMRILARGEATLVIDRRPAAGKDARRTIDLPKGAHKEVMDAVEAGLKDCKFDAAGSLAQRIYNAHLEPGNTTHPRDRR